jgi:hypothetical protein
LPTRAGSPQQHMPITVGPFCLTHPVNFPCGRKPEYPEETHDFRQSVEFYSFHMRTGFESHWESSHRDLNLRPQRWKASALTTWPPKPLYKSSWDQCVTWKYENSAICKTIVLGKLCWSSWTGLHPAWPFPLKKNFHRQKISLLKVASKFFLRRKICVGQSRFTKIRLSAENFPEWKWP